MESRTPVERSTTIAGSTPRELYAIVTDFDAYPRLFPELKGARIVERRDKIVRVEFRAEIVLAVRYVLDLVCDPEALTVDWTFVEGEIVADSVGAWRFAAAGDGTKVDYRVAITVRAPLPGFIVKRATDALVNASIPGMFTSLDREAARRRAARPATT